MKRVLPMILLLVLLLQLCACGTEKTEPMVEEYPLKAEGTHMGYLPQEIPAPEDWGDMRDVTLCGDRIYATGTNRISQEDLMNGPVTVTPWLGVYQLSEDRWQLIMLPEEVAGEFRSISAKDGILWALLVEYTEVGFTFDLLHYNEASDEVEFRSIPFSAAEGQIGFGFAGLVALGNGQAILYDEKNNYVINSEGNCLKTIPNTEGNWDCRMESGEEIFARCTKDGQDGFTRFNTETLSFTDFIPLDTATIESSEFVSAGKVRSSRCESERGSFLLCGNDGLYRFDNSNGSTESLSPWTDLALRARDLTMPQVTVLESQNGDLYCCPFGSYLIKLQPAELKNKITLRFACYGNRHQYQDAIIRFNNTSSDYKIELVSFDQFTPGELERFQIEFATGYHYDIIDTALLPPGSADGSVLADLLPLIDSDPDYSREDFIQPILQGMMKNGGLYELIPSVTIMSLAVSPDDFPGEAAWAMEAITGTRVGKPVFSARWNREQLLDWFCLAASAEFVDWENGTCSFDSDLFKSWLQLIKDASISNDLGEAVLLSPQYSATAGAWPYLDELDGQYVFAGLPGASSKGYFMRLSDLPGDQADEIRLGIPANSPYREAAWEFLRIFLLPEYGYDIPILKSSFEARLETYIGKKIYLPDAPSFSTEDAEKLRELVYTSTKSIREEGTLREMIRTEASAYLSGQRDLDETAALIQSRASIYIAEQYS